MLKVRMDPEGKLQQAGSKVFPIDQESLCPKHSYLFLDMLRLVLLVCEHEKASIDLIKVWYADVKTYMDFMFAED